MDNSKYWNKEWVVQYLSKQFVGNENLFLLAFEFILHFTRIFLYFTSITSFHFYLNNTPTERGNVPLNPIQTTYTLI